MQKILEIKNVTKQYSSGLNAVMALDNVSFSVLKGDFVAIMGPSGSGKSTLLNVIGGLDTLTSGEVELNGNKINRLDENSLVSLRRGEISYIFQQYHLLSFLTALENVMLPLVFCGRNEDREIALEYLEKVGLATRKNHKPGDLSGGEQQRVAIARALVNKPSLILADEPTGNLDQETGKNLLALFSSLSEAGQTIIVVTHDDNVAGQANSIIRLRDGRIVKNQ